MKELDKKEIPKMSNDYVESLKRETIAKSTIQHKEQLKNTTDAAFRIPRDFLGIAKYNDLFLCQPPIVMAVDPASERSDAALTRHKNKFEDFLCGISDIGKDAELMHEQITGAKLKTKVVSDRYPDRVAITFDSCYIKAMYVCQKREIQAIPYPHNIQKIRNKILGKIEHDLLNNRSRIAPPTIHNNCQRREDPEIKAIVASAMERLNLNPIKSLENKNE